MEDQFKSKYNFTKEEWDTCIKVLTILKENPHQNPDNTTLAVLVKQLRKKVKKIKVDPILKERRENDLDIIKRSEIAQQALNNKTTYVASEKKQQSFSVIQKPKNCYGCNTSFSLVHSFYHRLCPPCAELNYNWRFKQVDLTGRKVIITGGRVKIGYATALKCLKMGAEVIVTSRFPASALHQYAQEEDYNTWKDRLTVYGLDLKNLKAVEEFTDYVKSKWTSLDILVNNAAQTIKYTNEYYTPVIEQEKQHGITYKEVQCLTLNTTPLYQEVEKIALTGTDLNYEVNRFGQPVDNRMKNSWNSLLEEVSPYELLEVNLINHISPFFLIQNFTDLLKSSTFKERFIINVTSSEGMFSYENKTMFHPHTNMTKAALNMLTKTSAIEYKSYGIFMNAVDVGWVSTGAHEVLREKQFERGYIPPLDSVDGACRILQPIVDQIENTADLSGVLFKDYKPHKW